MSENINKQLDKDMNKDMDNNIDKLELYSFVIYLYIYIQFYIYAFKHNFLNFIVINILGNGLLYITINHNMIKMITHKYWRKSLNNIAMPQLLTSLCNTHLLEIDLLGLNNKIFIIPKYFITYYLISNMYKKEIKESYHLRIFINIIYVFIYLFIY